VQEIELRVLRTIEQSASDNQREMLRHGWQVLLRSREDEFTLKCSSLNFKAKALLKSVNWLHYDNQVQAKAAK
jgi:hypothetical protein